MTLIVLQHTLNEFHVNDLISVRSDLYINVDTVL